MSETILLKAGAIVALILTAVLLDIFVWVPLGDNALSFVVAFAFGMLTGKIMR